MGRTPKKGLEWFQCDVDIQESNSAQALTMVVGRNNGIAFLVTLFTMIGRSEGQYIDCTIPAQWRIFASKTGLTDDEVSRCLDTLADLETIDSTAWRNSRTIWCPNFVARHKNYYSRTGAKPALPIRSTKGSVSADIRPNIRIEESAFGPVEIDTDWARVEDSYAAQIGNLPMGVHMDKLKDLYHQLGADIVILAIEETNRKQPANPRSYLIQVLTNWMDGGVRTVTQAQAQITEHNKRAKSTAKETPQQPQQASGGDSPEDVNWL